jgi:molybdopterin-guanine dinucleotide biosynthesis protein A
MAGLLGLVEYAARFEYEFVLAVACDMPYLNEELLRQLHCKFPAAGALVPKREFLEPLCARYCVSTTLPHLQNLVSQGQYRMMSLLEKFGAGCVHLPVDFSNAETLKDWDAPSDLPAGVRVLGKPFCPGAK